MIQSLCPSCAIRVEATWSICVVCGTHLPTSLMRPTTESAAPVDTHTDATISVIEKDGQVSREFEFPISDGPRKTLGKGDADINFLNEPFLNDEHAALDWRNGILWLSDLQSKNGVFVRIRTAVELQNLDSFRAGEQLFTVEHDGQKNEAPDPDSPPVQFNGTPSPPWNFRVQQIFAGGIVGAAWPVFSSNFVIGREGSDASFTDDRFMSRSHCEVFQQNDKIHLRDQMSRNGTYIRIRDAHRVQNGDYIRLGERLLRFTYKS